MSIAVKSTPAKNPGGPVDGRGHAMFGWEENLKKVTEGELEIGDEFVSNLS